ncbi:MAG: LPP20 family lipoprotein [Treponema sp.]|jgi:hypothetical protein|nr:LPP20 family lipoprotein [Treponema sp.]
MKRFVGVSAVLFLALVFSGCISSQRNMTATPTATGPDTTVSAAAAKPERKVGGIVPAFVKDALRKAPEDALIGIGTAKAATLNMARTVAATRARAEISRQINTMIKDMVTDYTAGSEVDPSAAISFQENITIALSKSTLTGAAPVDEDMDENNNYWVVVMLSKANTVNEINQAQAAAKLAVPAMKAFEASERMEAAFEKAYESEIVITNE